MDLVPVRVGGSYGGFRWGDDRVRARLGRLRQQLLPGLRMEPAGVI